MSFHIQHAYKEPRRAESHKDSLSATCTARTTSQSYCCIPVANFQNTSELSLTRQKEPVCVSMGRSVNGVLGT